MGLWLSGIRKEDLSTSVMSEHASTLATFRGRQLAPSLPVVALRGRPAVIESEGHCETPQEPSSEVMDAWMAWFGQLGEAVVDMAHPSVPLQPSHRMEHQARAAGRTRPPAIRSLRQQIFTMPSSWPRDARG